MDWFGGRLCPRFTNLQSQLKHLYCGDDLDQYNDWLIKPVGKIDRQLIEDEWPNIVPIIKALGLKEITQSILVKNYAHTPLTTELARQSWSMTNSFVAFIPSNIYKTGNYNAISIVHRIVWNRIINYAQPLQQRMGKNNYLAKVIVKLRSAPVWQTHCQCYYSL
ncbi:Tn3 transposase DDE domain [Legionella feeleii]|uniref:Tn3 transposase DDE domain n=1 Tax=Legionella feeleii TaxID=453 RepID=A0A2X1QTG9_9GAMM|nr:Tn3 transposase DDE domain [Legionella feeleii]